MWSPTQIQKGISAQKKTATHILDSEFSSLSSHTNTASATDERHRELWRKNNPAIISQPNKRSLLSVLRFCKFCARTSTSQSAQELRPRRRNNLLPTTAPPQLSIINHCATQHRRSTTSRSNHRNYISTRFFRLRSSLGLFISAAVKSPSDAPPSDSSSIPCTVDTAVLLSPIESHARSGNRSFRRPPDPLPATIIEMTTIIEVGE